MLRRPVLHLVNILVAALERAIGWILGVMDFLAVLYGRRFFESLAREVLQRIGRLLFLGKRYFEQVRTTLRYRLYFEAVTRPIHTHYKALKKR
jgi:hypothetical protein